MQQQVQLVPRRQLQPWDCYPAQRSRILMAWDGRKTLEHSLQEAFSEDAELLSKREADFTSEHIVIEPNNFLQQAAIDVDEHPERRLAVF